MDLESIRKNKIAMILLFSIPSIIAMVLTSLINVADGYFIGNYVGKEGITAVNLGLPIVYLFLATGLMLAVGGSAIASMAYGAGDKKSCGNVFNQTMLTTVIVFVLVSLLVYVGFEPMLHFLHANEKVSMYFRDYYTILLLELPIMVINSSMGMFIRGEGHPQYYMLVNIVNVVLNIILDYISVRVFHLGVAGVALASLLSAIVALIAMIYYFVRVSKVYRFHRFSFSKEVFRNTMFNGSSEFIGEMSMSISMFAYNYVILKNIGVNGVTAFTIVGYVSYVFSMIIIGFGQGASPLISFSYGAREKSLAVGLRKTTNCFVFVAGVIVLTVMVLLSGWYSSIFVKTSAVKSMVQSGLWIFMISFLFSGINTITSFYFTSIGKAKESAVISSSRGLVVLLICIFTLPVWFGMKGVWMVAPVTEVMTILLSIYFIYRNDRSINTKECCIDN